MPPAISPSGGACQTQELQDRKQTAPSQMQQPSRAKGEMCSDVAIARTDVDPHLTMRASYLPPIADMSPQPSSNSVINKLSNALTATTLDEPRVFMSKSLVLTWNRRKFRGKRLPSWDTGPGGCSKSRKARKMAAKRKGEETKKQQSQQAKSVGTLPAPTSKRYRLRPHALLARKATEPRLLRVDQPI